jgi:hypothetical protein
MMQRQCTFSSRPLLVVFSLSLSLTRNQTMARSPSNETAHLNVDRYRALHRCRASSVIVPTDDWTETCSFKSTVNSIQTVNPNTTAGRIDARSNTVRVRTSVSRFAFDTFDKNDDGTIDFDEFLLAVAATGQGNLDDRLSVAFDVLFEQIVSRYFFLFALYEFSYDTVHRERMDSNDRKKLSTK